MKKTILTLILLLIISSISVTATCDQGENPWNNPEECTKLNLDTILCLEEDACVWDEDWFIKGFVSTLLAIVAFLIYKELD